MSKSNLRITQGGGAPGEAPQAVESSTAAINKEMPTAESKSLFVKQTLPRMPLRREILDLLNEEGKYWNDAIFQEIKKKSTKPGKYKKQTAANTGQQAAPASDMKDVKTSVNESALSYLVVEGNKASDERRYFVVFPGKFAKGGIGHARIVQEHVTGKFYVAKFQDSFQTDIFTEEEYAVLKELRQAEGEILREKTSKKTGMKFEQHIFMMKWAPGYNLLELKSKNPSFQEWIKIFLKMLHEIQQFHARKWLHRDLSVKNVIYDPSEEKTQLIDFGFTKKANDDKFEVQALGGQGTKVFMPPETRVSKMVIHNEATEVYQVGRTLAYLLDFLLIHESASPKGAPPTIEFIKKNSAAYHAYTKIPNIDLRNSVYDFIARMVDKDPKNRPSIGQAILFFEAVQDNILDLVSMIKKSAVINLDEYLNMNDAQKAMLHKNLLMFDEIILMGQTPAYKPKQLLKARLELELQGLSVNNEMFHAVPDSKATSEDLFSAIYDDLDKNEKKLRSYFYLTADDKKITDPKLLGKQKSCILWAFSSEEEMEKSISKHRKNCRERAVVHKAIHSLNREIFRLQHKYKKGDEHAEQRILEICLTRDNLFKWQNALTIDGIIKELDSLEKKMYKIFSTESSKHIEKVKKETEAHRHLFQKKKKKK